MKSFLSSALFVVVITSTAQSDLRKIYNEGVEAYKIQDFETFLSRMRLADSLSPMHPTITYNLAAALALNQRKAEAKKQLIRAITMNAGLEPENDKDFEGLDLSRILDLKDDLNKEVTSGEVAFENPEFDLHPESLAFDPQTGHFFLNSVRKGKILRYDSKSDTFTTFSSGHWAVMGMRVHKEFLWACEVATPEFEGYDEMNQGKTALLKIDLMSGQLVNRWELGGGHWFGDVILSNDGTPYVSDSKAPQIYVIENGELRLFKDFAGKLFNLQGLAFNRDETKLYLADYKIGIHRLDMVTGGLEPISNMNYQLKGTDGLYFYKNSLITIQNGVIPFRVSRVFLNEFGMMDRITYLDKSRPELKEPTLGVITKDAFYYVANSPWGAYKDGKLNRQEGTNNLIMKLSLMD